MEQVLTADGEIYEAEEPVEARTIQLLVDIGGEIASIQGTHERWLGKTKDDLTGKPITMVVNEESVILVSEILCKAALQETMDEFVLFLEGANYQILGCLVTGQPLARNPDYYHLEVIVDPSIPYSPKARNSPKGLTDSVRRTMLQNQGADLDLTFVDVGEVDRLTEDLGVSEDELNKFRQQVSDRLNSESIGETVSEVDNGKYGFVHQNGADLDALQSDLKSFAADVDPLEQVLAIGTSTVALDTSDLSEEQISTAIANAVDEFVDNGLDAIIFDTLEASQAAWVDKRANRTELLREVLEKGGLTVAFRPVVDAGAWEADHLFSEFRADLEDDGLGAEEILSLTKKDPALRKRVDLEQCRYVVDVTAVNQAGIALQIAIRSLLDPALLQKLLDFAKIGLNGVVILRIEGLTPEILPRITALQTLRDAGFRVALFGTEIGAISEERLATLPSDYIILDPTLSLDADALLRSLPALAGLAERCASHNIGVIFDGVVDQESITLLQSISGALATGPYYGDPISDPADAPMPIRALG